MKMGCYILRTIPSEDKNYLCTVFSDNNIFIRSRSHAEYFTNMFGINVNETPYFDDSNTVKLCRFKSKKYGWVEV